LSGATIQWEHHKSAMNIVMKMNDSLRMSKAAPFQKPPACSCGESSLKKKDMYLCPIV
jgi:hypothetical protein